MILTAPAEVEQTDRDRLDYYHYWTRWLTAGDVIIASSWECADTDLILESSTFSTSMTSVWIRGGVEGTTYSVFNHILTAQGREMTVMLTMRIIQGD